MAQHWILSTEPTLQFMSNTDQFLICSVSFTYILALSGNFRLFPKLSEDIKRFFMKIAPDKIGRQYKELKKTTSKR